MARHGRAAREPAQDVNEENAMWREYRAVNKAAARAHAKDAARHLDELQKCGTVRWERFTDTHWRVTGFKLATVNGKLGRVELAVDYYPTRGTITQDGRRRDDAFGVLDAVRIVSGFEPKGRR